MKVINLPTGKLFVEQYSKGELETLSIADYGKSKNVKADFLGYTRELNGVPNGDIIPLQEKWVITLSTQYGCAVGCRFCDVPNVEFKGNATQDDLYDQFINALAIYPEVKYTDRLNIHFARMGEPVYNHQNVFGFARWVAHNKVAVFKKTGVRLETVHPVFTTMCPKGTELTDILQEWVSIKNHVYSGQAGLQLSINSTNDDQREDMFNGRAMSLEDVSEAVKHLPDPIGRKYTLNIAYASGYEVDGARLAKLFDTDKWMVKITPIHNNNSTDKNDIKTIDGYNSYMPYREPEQSCLNAGFDVLVFIPSMDEEDGTITCGNAVLGGSKVTNEVKE